MIIKQQQHYLTYLVVNWIPELVVRSKHDEATPGNGEREKHLFCGFSPDGDFEKFLPFWHEEIPKIENLLLGHQINFSSSFSPLWPVI